MRTEEWVLIIDYFFSNAKVHKLLQYMVLKNNKKATLFKLK